MERICKGISLLWVEGEMGRGRGRQFVKVYVYCGLREKGGERGRQVVKVYVYCGLREREGEGGRQVV